MSLRGFHAVTQRTLHVSALHTWLFMRSDNFQRMRLLAAARPGKTAAAAQIERRKYNIQI